MAQIMQMFSKASSFESLDSERAQQQWKQYCSSGDRKTKEKITEVLRARIAKMPEEDAGLAVCMGVHLAPILYSKILLKELREQHASSQQRAQHEQQLIQVCACCS